MKNYIKKYIEKIVDEKIDSRGIFKSKKEQENADTLNNYAGFGNLYWGWAPQSLEEEIMELQDKLDAITKGMKGELVKTSAKDSEWVFKTKKK